MKMPGAVCCRCGYNNRTMKISDHDERKQRPQSSPLSGLLTQAFQHRFQRSLSQFENASVEADSPLHKMKGVEFLMNRALQLLPNPAEMVTQVAQIEKPEAALPAAAEGLANLESLSRLQTEKTITPPKSTASGPKPFQDAVSEASQTYGVPVALINAVIRQESAFNPNAKSPVGAEGLMQLMPATAKAYGCTNSADPRQNIMAGTRFLGDLLKKYKGDVELALAGYNAGPGNVAKYGNQVPPFKETQNYVVKVQQYYSQNLAAAEEGSQMYAVNKGSNITLG